MTEEKESIMLEPRDYQIKLIEIAVRENTIIYLPTGSGKTFIAVMVLKRLGQPLQMPVSQGGKISVMLVNTVALVDQQSQYIGRFTPFSVGGYSGELNVDGWKEEKWKEEFDKHQVLVMTSQIFLNIIEASYISLSSINLLIFDECHRGVNDHSMRQIMKNFGELQDEQPRVMGLTATLLNKNCSPHQAMNEVQSLETTFHSKVATVDELKNVIGYSTNPKENTRIFHTHIPLHIDSKIVEYFNNLMVILDKFHLNTAPVSPPKSSLKPLEPEKGLQDLVNLIQDTVTHINLFGAFGGRLAVIAHMIQLERIKKHCQDAKLTYILEGVMTAFMYAKKLLSDEMKPFRESEQIRRFSSQQIHVLLEILKEYKNDSNDSLCGIIFVKRRFTAKVLYNVLLRLKAVDSEYEFLSPNFIVGYHTNPFSDTREGLYNVKMNKKVLNEFRNHEINLLVATNVLEEGVDIPTCTLVVKFDKPDDYRAYIQSKGRARHKNSFYYLMIDSSEAEKFQRRYTVFQAVENLLNDYLVGHNETRVPPSSEQLQELYDENAIPPYYVSGPGSAQVTLLSAISLLCRYCLSLPSDKYTSYTPTWYVEELIYEIEKFYKVVVELPRVCPLWREPIEGQYMRTKKLAKRAAALKACALLHKNGELDDKLIPKAQDIIDEDVSYFFCHWSDIKEKDAGNTKKRRVHPKQIPDISRGSITDNQEAYLHIIDFNPLFFPNDNGQRMIHEVYTSDLCFGILSAHPLPRLCKFSIYVSLGEIEVNVNVIQEIFVFNKDQIMQLRAFHTLVFKDVLNVLKNFLIFNNDENAEGFLVVPVRKSDHKIDFDVVINNTELADQRTEPSDQEKAKIVVTEETYLGKIVTPWYRPVDKQYLVISVCTHLNAYSKFPSEDFDTYASYFNDKYRTNVLYPKQPLLLVKGLSKRLNCLKPRHTGGKRSKERSYEEMEEHLIPELCIKQDFPSQLWIQANLLPSIFYRLYGLLQAEELRRTIAFESGLGIVEISINESWLPLSLDKHLLKIDELPKSKPRKKEDDEPGSVIASLPNNVIQQLVQDFACKKLESEFPWQEKDEPVDIERSLDVTLMDIQYYENFISQRVSVTERLRKHEVWNKTDYPAITFNQEFQHKDINLLKQRKCYKGPELAEIFRALTAARCNDVINLERLETLGDSFLKLSTSLFILLRFPKYNEGKATTLKGQLISNKNLYYIGFAKKLAGYLRNSDFEPTCDWKPPGFCVPHHLEVKINEKQMPSNSLFNFMFSRDEQISGYLENQEDYDNETEEETDESAYDSMITFLDQQLVSDKTVADSVEALIGAYFESCGFVDGLKLLEWLNIIPASENIESLLQKELPNPVITNAINISVDSHIPLWRDIERRLGYHFNNRAYLLQALTHSSYTPNRITYCYQTLEFLGDAILDFLITCHIYEICRDLNPGQLTDLRSALVNNITFAGFTVRCGFHKFLLFSNNTLLDYIDNFVGFQESKDHAINDEVLILLEENDLYLSEHIDVPKVLGDVFEALAGAIFLDSGMDLETVWRVFYRIMWKEIESFRQNVPKNTVRLLYETVGAHPEYQKAATVDNGRTMVGLDFMLNGAKKRVYGFGENKVLAKKAAAKIALRLLHN
ncbi:hypothetical protein ILUMI_05788 [Ignelater luminosus]|uniref:Dicer-2 n=1 Tax=Ignelater luminosus TaxID=2038154 RepID=A0A8K0D9U0_IGNLU|nr:hypothetical protein ILUMI_05788 [Ignelater luminosus]